ncbi:MAG: hypothetical protein ACR2OJ_14975 [Hyphomicrobiales bacterium]
MMLNLVVWFVGLLISAIPIVIVFSSYIVPGANEISGLTLIDVARQAYPNILFVVIAVSGIAIAEAILVFFRMVETGQQRATAALWLLCSVLLIIYGAISYGQVAGSSFVPAAISSQQIWYALIAAAIALAAAISLRSSMMQLERVARRQIQEEAAVAPLDLSAERSGFGAVEEDPYDLSNLGADTQTEQVEEEAAAVIEDQTDKAKTPGKSGKKS